jgi:SAM-dependent methyltransferase
LTPYPTLHWTESGQVCSARWRSERGAPPLKKVVLADDTLSADAAYKLACEGTALLWRGDFQNARQMLQALGRRIDQSAKAGKRVRSKKQQADATKTIAAHASAAGATAENADKAEMDAKAFHLYRQAQSQRARVLGMVLLSFDADYGISLRRSPDARLACAQGWGEPVVGGGEGSGTCVASLRELMGLISAYEWRKKGVEVHALGMAPNNRIHPHYGVFSPVRGEYVALVAQAPLPAGLTDDARVFDVGTGSGVLSAVLARRGVQHIVATDLNPRALACAQDNLMKLGVAGQVELQAVDLFPQGRATLIVCNPPWLPARPGSPIEHAVYDEGSGMLLGFLNGLAAHLTPEGEGWLILSDLAEHLGLRSRAMLTQAFDTAGLEVRGRLDTTPVHGKAQDADDPLHAARSKEVTSLWRLGAKRAVP